MGNIPFSLLMLDYENDIATISYSVDKNNKGCKYLKALVKSENMHLRKNFGSLNLQNVEEKNNLKYINNIRYVIK